MNISIIQPRRKSNKKSLKHWKPPLKKYFINKKYYPLFTKHRRFIYNDHSKLKPWNIEWRSDKFDERSELISQIWRGITDRSNKLRDYDPLSIFYHRCTHYISISPKFAKIIFDYKLNPPYLLEHKEVKRWSKAERKIIEKKFKRENRQLRNMKLLDLTEGIYASLSNELL